MSTEIIYCPVCNSTNTTDTSQYATNGVIGPGNKRWKVFDSRMCNECGVLFRPVEAKENGNNSKQFFSKEDIKKVSDELIEYCHSYGWHYGRVFHIGDAEKILAHISEKFQLPEEFMNEYIEALIKKVELNAYQKGLEDGRKKQ